MKTTPDQMHPPARSLPFAGKLFFAFLRLGLTAFGGPAMVAYIRDLAIKKNHWLSEESFKQGVAICQIIPGATAMQVAAYVGLRSRGPVGAILAYVGFGLPAFLLMVVLAAFYQNTHDQVAVVSIFLGLQVIVIAMVANATWTFGQNTIKNRRDIILGIAVTVFLLMQGNPIIVIFASAFLGVVLYGKAEVSIAKPFPRYSAITFNQIKMPLLLTLALLAGIVFLYFSNRQLFELALLMTKVDFLAFGGGYGSIPLMLNEVVAVRHWLDMKTFMDGIALGQVTPGPIVITATFVGYLVAFLPGALIGTISIFTPSLIMLTLAVPCFDRIQNNVLFKKGIHGISVSFVGLLLSVTLRFIHTVQWEAYKILILALALLALRMKVDILWVVLVGAALSFIFL
jgi:chromate transporter